MMIEIGDGWAERELGGARLLDSRRSRRLVDLAQTLAQDPGAALPQATRTPARLRAAQRLWDSPAVSPAAIREPHVAATCARMQEPPVVLAVQDTTELDLSHFPTMSGRGPLSSPRQQGLLLPSTLAFVPAQDDQPALPLGVLDQPVWARDPATFGQLPDHKRRPIAAKESAKWLGGLAAVSALVARGQIGAATTVVVVGDRESDIYDVLAAPRPPTVHLLVRATRNRAVEGEQPYLWEAMGAAPVVATLALDLPARAGRRARAVALSLRVTEVTLRPPRHRASEHWPPVTVWAVWAHESAPPADTEPVSWLLLTTWPRPTVAAAQTCLQWYSSRWGIEVWHRILKSGCRIESRQFDDVAAFGRCLSLYSIIAGRVQAATLLARAAPDQPCTAVLEPDEWRALWCVVHPATPLPAAPPTVEQALGWLAQQGGYQPRPGRPFGPTTVWRGFAWLAGATAVYRALTAHPPPLPHALSPPAFV